MKNNCVCCIDHDCQVEYEAGYVEGGNMIKYCIDAPIVRDAKEYIMACVYAVKIQTKANVYSECFLEGYEQAVKDYFK